MSGQKLTSLEQTWEMLWMYSLGQHPLDQPWVKLVSRPNDRDMGDKGNLVDRAEKRCSWNWGCQGGCFSPSCFRSIVLLFGVTVSLRQWGRTWRPLQRWKFGICSGRRVPIGTGHRAGWQQVLCKDPDSILVLANFSQTRSSQWSSKSHFLGSLQSLFDALSRFRGLYPRNHHLPYEQA